VEPLFVDTSAWVAVVNSRDRYHPVAGDFYRHCFNNYARLITSNLVVAETYIMLQLDCSSSAALQWWDKITDSIKSRLYQAAGGKINFSRHTWIADVDI